MAFDYEAKRVLAVESIQWTKKLTVEEQIAQIDLFVLQSQWIKPAHFAIVYLSHSSEIFTLIPDPFFTIGSETGVLGLVAPVDEEQVQVLSNHHIQRDFHLIYALPKPWESWSNRRFEGTNYQWLSEVSSFVEAGFGLSAHASGKFLLALVDLNSVLFLGLDGDKLLFVNRFYYQSENDLLYFFLLAMETCNVDPVEGRVILSGAILPGSVGFEKLARYINRMEWVKSPSEIQIPEKLLALAHHSWFDLLSLPLCINQLA